jgi:tetratricopeptide (TPR) repeat protein
MSRTIFALLFCLLSIAASGQQSADKDSLFIKANKAYSNDKYEDAAGLYEQILTGGMESPEVYYNLGNAYFKTRNYPKAILNFERALRLDPLNENIRFNLEKSQVYNMDQINEIPEFIIRRGLRNVLEIFSPNTWAYISLFTFIIGLSLLLIYFLSFKIYLKRIGLYAGIAALIISVSTFFIAGSAKNFILKSGGAIVMTPTVTVKGSPDAGSTDLFLIHEGTKVFILDKIDNWYEIKLMDGKQGWLQQSEVEPI